VQARPPGPAEALYLQLSSIGLDPSRVFRVREASLDRPSIHITLEDGTIAFTKDSLGRITGGFFAGEGELLLVPPNDVERRSMSLFTGMAILEERFSTAYFRFNDNTAAELQPGLRAPQDGQDFVVRWDETARNLAQSDAMRLLAGFSEMLPVAGEDSSAVKRVDPEDRLLHARLQGNKLGVFDVVFDSTAGEQVEAGQSKRVESGNLYYDVWTSFSTANAGRNRVAQRDIPQTLPAETESREDPILVRSYVIDAHVKPPKELDAEVNLSLNVRRGGFRFLVFELSRFLQIQTVEADGSPVEFIHNPAVEGTRLARSGNDLVAVILPKPAIKGQKIKLRFVYGGEVIAEAGKGLLYVGERGTWYPNRGMAMANFDLTFHYPPGWTLVATGKPMPAPQQSAPSAQTENAGKEQVGRWVSERPIPVAGFNLGKYIRGAAQAGNVKVETYATVGVERNFSKGTPQVDQEERADLHMDPVHSLLGQMVPAHEAAHQWWGDLITWSTYRDQWFSEGLANYSSLMLLQESNPAGFRQIMEKYRQDLANENKDGNFTKDAGPVTLGSRLLSSHFPGGYEAISYGRATWLFHMLRSMLLDTAEDAGKKDPGRGIAEERFVRSLRKIRERYEGRAISTRELLNVFAEDLRPSLRYEGKASLDWFLDGWINGTSVPRLELRNVKFVTKGNATIVSGAIRQEDAPEDLVTSVPIYAVVSGKAPVLAGRVFADGPESPFRLTVPQGTHKLLLDPNGTILTAPK